MSSAIALAPRLAAARLRDLRGGRWLDGLAVAAFTVSTWLALTVAGGTWMFWQRQPHPPAGLAGMFAHPGQLDGFLQTYVLLALIACGLLVAPILTLGGAAARLGARGRGQRLAALRLIGATGAEVVGIAVVEAAVQALVGIALGTVIWLLVLPAWRAIGFQGIALDPLTLVPPVWLGLATAGAVLVLALASTVLGLRSVRISPLGVAGRQTPPALRWWRGLALMAAIGGALALAQSPGIAHRETTVYLVMAAALAIVLGFINLVGPVVLQTVARLGVNTRSVATLLAARRIVADPRGAWRNVGGLALVSAVAGYVCLSPVEVIGRAERADAILLVDIRTGILLTLGIGLVLAACSTLIAQASAVFDRRGELVALDRIGTPRPLLHRARLREVLVPVVVTAVGSAVVGVALALPFLKALALLPNSGGVLLLAGALVVGTGLAAAASAACRPLVGVAIDGIGRRND